MKNIRTASGNEVHNGINDENAEGLRVLRTVADAKELSQQYKEHVV